MRIAAVERRISLGDRNKSLDWVAVVVVFVADSDEEYGPCFDRFRLQRIVLLRGCPRKEKAVVMYPNTKIVRFLLV
jgi:hypothetical protein